MDTIVTKVVGGVAAGIGLVSEGISAKKKQSAAKKLAAQDRAITPSPAPPSYDEALEEHDEEQWDLDDAQSELKQLAADGAGSSAPADKPTHNVHKLTDAFMAKHPVPVAISEAGRIGLPVVLPQRRPKGRSRGFIRAYAPALEIKGIDQATFLEFIETFDLASQASPWIQAVNLASFATIPLAPPFSFLVSMAIQVTADVATEMHARKRTNTFMDRANTEFFRPRGLYCLVMTWNPESDRRSDTIDITSTISSRVTAESSISRTQKLKDQFSTSNGNTYGDVVFPEAAPLVFPALDDLADQTGEDAATKMQKLKKAKNFTSEYFDRRAVAKYAGQNPNSVLASQVGSPTFTSRYADPNHPASNGNLISLVTGGHVNPSNLGAGGSLIRRGYGRDGYSRKGLDGGLIGGFGGGSLGQRGRGLENTGVGMLIGSLVERHRNQSRGGPQGGQQSYADEKRSLQDERQYSQQQGQGSMGLGRGGRGNGMDHPLAMLNPIMGIQRILKQQVLYMMIVDMPTDDQLAAASEDLKRAG